jgi:hypothetical protein
MRLAGTSTSRVIRTPVSALNASTSTGKHNTIPYSHIMEASPCAQL